MIVSKKRVIVVLSSLISIVFILPAVLTGVIHFLPMQTTAQEGDLTVTINQENIYYKNNTYLTNGYIYWTQLSGGRLTLYANTSLIHEYEFWDQGGVYPSDLLSVYPDRIVISIRTTELYYRIYADYQPDYFMDTNFVVIFNTFWALFSYITPEGDSQYAPINYYNRQILPEGAGIVSYAPTDGAVIIKEGSSFGVEWEYKERKMDPFHDPLTYEITYNFDPIYLQFTEQMFQNQQQLQKLESEQNLLDLLKTYFTFVAFLAVFLSLVAAIVGYLQAKRKLKSQLEQARNLPRRLLKDIESEKEPGKRITTLFNIFLLLLVFSPILIADSNASLNYSNEIDMQSPYYGGVSLEGITPLDTGRNIQYESVIDLGKDEIAFENVKISLPYTVANYSIWLDTKDVLSFKAYDRNGAPISYQQFDNRYLIRNVQGYLNYELVRPYTYYNNSNILVYLDFCFLEFFDPELSNYSKADIIYSVILPEGAALISASPEALLSISETGNNRRKVTFIDNNRAIDPYHDPFSCQITYSFINILEAIENQSARFEHFRVRTDLTQEQISTLTQNVIFISLFAIIAPILAFLISYYTFRNRMLKKIQEEEQKHELLIAIEEAQLQSLITSIQIDSNVEPWKSMLGGYWEMLSYLSRYTPVNLLQHNEALQEKIIDKYVPPFIISEILEILSIGRALAQNTDADELIIYTKQQARDYLASIYKLIEKLEKWRKEQE